ncbi:hypothetical protein G5B40_20165 [Pikeienuella piscinae]|uniref:Uncharacterized protein n=1 Tax=Pikeienuella piscinae TaxID=2748098 RepID=A0A7M3T6C7_9RHOB|nr:hypothetical protein [Pikeienuella piscinae]QIE57558.1 hypothetical protein G5B40_20165 [Pikeienuella piscinae]
MAVTRSVAVYGFGSAFAKIGTPKIVANDVDLLILHQGVNLDSCRFAIACKRYLQDSVTYAHITMLSNTEEKHCQFIKTAQAVRLGTIHEACIGGDLKLLQRALRLLASPCKSHD